MEQSVIYSSVMAEHTGQVSCEDFAQFQVIHECLIDILSCLSNKWTLSDISMMDLPFKAIYTVEMSKCTAIERCVMQNMHLRNVQRFQILLLLPEFLNILVPGIVFETITQDCSK